MIVPGRVNIGVQHLDAPNATPAIVPMGQPGQMQIVIAGGMSREEVHFGNIVAGNPSIDLDYARDLARKIVSMASEKPEESTTEPTIQTR